MHIYRDRKVHKLWLSQEKFIQRLNMENTKPLSQPLANHSKLIKRLCPSSKEEMDEVLIVTYSFAVGSMMYAIM